MTDIELTLAPALQKVLEMSERVFWFIIDREGSLIEFSGNFQRLLGEFNDLRGRQVGEVFLSSSPSTGSLSFKDFKIGQEPSPILVRQAMSGRPCRIVASNLSESLLCWGEVIGDRSTTGLEELSSITGQMQSLLLETHRQKTLIEKDLEAAAWLQQRLLPKYNSCSGVETAWEFRPCERVGGDLFGIFQLPTGDISVYFIDVSGHGVPSAMMGVAVSQFLQQAVVNFVGQNDRHKKMGELLEKLEQEFPIERFNRYFTMVYLEFCPGSGAMTLVNAGHPSPILRRSKKAIVEIDQAGPFIGMGNSELIPVQEFSVEPGDCLFIYSDGLTERRNSQGDFFDKERLLTVLGNSLDTCLKDTVKALIAQNDAFADQKSAEDDLTLLGIEILPADSKDPN